MSRSSPRRPALALLLAFSLFSLAAQGGEARLEGRALYRERLALPANAVFEASLEDVSRAGAPAELLGRSTLDPAGQPPFRFSIGYDPQRLDPARNYAVRARITVNGQLWFTTDTIRPVLTRDHGDTVELLLKRVARSQPATAPAQASLVNTYWKLLKLHGATLAGHPGGREAYLVLNAEAGVSGFAGCNRFTGSYAQEAQSLKFGRLAATMMACSTESAPEQSFLAALDKVARWQIRGQELHLLDAEGRLMAEFEARYMQ